MTGPCRNQDSSLQQWNANLWWDLTRPKGLIQPCVSLRQYSSHCDSNFRPESPGTAFPWYMHNKLEERCYSQMTACGLGHAQHPPRSPPSKPHFLSSCISSHGEVAGLNGQSSGKILAQIDLSFYMRSHPPSCPLLWYRLPAQEPRLGILQH